ncbi:AraC family transcriptional regulator [Paenibacillus sp. PK3_47]|nr:AraC family transcriptional regulator [Paenibacillus sp. PK3_47]
MIAKSTGYRDPTHFRQGFRKIMGTSPSDYRKSGQQKQT